MTPADELTAAADKLEPLAIAAQKDVDTGDYWACYDSATAWHDGLTNGMGGASGDLAGALPPVAVRELARWLRSAARDAREIGPDPHALAVARAINGSSTPLDSGRQPAAVAVEHCVHDRTIHQHHHHTPVDGCPWCAATVEARS